MFYKSKRGTPGRRLTRWLNDDSVRRAKIKSLDKDHQAKFMSPRQKREWMADERDYE